MQIETEKLKARIYRELDELEELRSRLQSKLEAIETVEKLADELAPREEEEAGPAEIHKPPYGQPPDD